jgi:hypothetical protein
MFLRKRSPPKDKELERAEDSKQQAEEAARRLEALRAQTKLYQRGGNGSTGS